MPAIIHDVFKSSLVRSARGVPWNVETRSLMLQTSTGTQLGIFLVCSRIRCRARRNVEQYKFIPFSCSHFSPFSPLTEWNLLARVRRQEEGKKCQRGNQGTWNNEVEAVVQCAATDVDEKRDINVRLRTTVVQLYVTHYRTIWKEIWREMWHLGKAPYNNHTTLSMIVPVDAGKEEHNDAMTWKRFP